MFFLQNTITGFLNQHEKNAQHDEKIFLQLVRTLVPIDLLDAHVGEIRFQDDIGRLVGRINLFLSAYSENSKKEAISKYFNTLVLPGFSENIITSVPVSNPMQSPVQAVDNGYRRMDDDTARGNPHWTAACAQLSCYGCYACVSVIGSCVIQHNQNTGIEQQISGQSYSGGFGGVFSGNAGGYASAWCNSQEYGCCKDLFGSNVAQLCCGAHQRDLATASAMNGGDAPTGIVSFLNGSWCQYQSTLCNNEFYHDLTHCFGSLGHCFSQVPDAIGHILHVVIHGLGAAINLIGEICNLLGKCNCGEVSAEVGQFFAGVFAAICTAFYFIYDSITGKKHKHERRLVEQVIDQTSSKFIPSMVAMSISLFIFFPRVMASLLQAVHNLMHNIAFYQNLRLLAAELVIGFPIAFCAGYLGGASGWTYTTLVCVGMYIACAFEQLHNELVNGKLSEVCYLSSKEWKKMPVDLDLRKFAEQQLALNSSLTTKRRDIQSGSRIGYGVTVLWPQVADLFARQGLFSQITQSRNLENVPKLKV